ncbi:hypothetical protein CUJ83_10145 [Methanocella sp. CWC-04]|uniref:Uncharacterized protein n=1 Tax=Methanooceanicella nereidis TaxID=2052831 RepID=A0AAP2RDN7_9EURY|nr:hypothetical protein [Methanocella sp. CWC-04]
MPPDGTEGGFDVGVDVGEAVALGVGVGVDVGTGVGVGVGGTGGAATASNDITLANNASTNTADTNLFKLFLLILEPPIAP